MTKLAPARNVGSIVISDSYAAWASTTVDALSPPPDRHGSPNRRAICPVHSRPTADSGVPKLGDPVFMSVLERNEPNTTGQPGFTSCVSAIPDSASAICCTSVAGIETGDIAPIRRNGVVMTAWLARLYSSIALSMRSSQRSGELQLISEIDTGARSIASAPPRHGLRAPDALGQALHGLRDLGRERLERVDHVEVARVERPVLRLHHRA